MPCIYELQSNNSIFSHRKIDIIKLTQIEFARKVANKLNYELISHIGCGANGSAYKLTSQRVLKLTTDINEVYTANRLIGDTSNYIVKYYDVKNIESKYLIGNLYAIVMDYLFILTDTKSCTFFDYFLNNFNEQENFFQKNIFNTDQIDNRIHYYKRNNLDNLLDDSKIQQYIYNLKCIAYDTKMLGIYPIDIHSGNLGSKVVDGDLIYFDIGANKNYSVEPIDSIIIL